MNNNNNNNFISIINLSKKYKNKFQALKNINLKIKKGELISLTGPSGSGKSTFLHMIALLDQPTGGNIYFEGKNKIVRWNYRTKDIKPFKINGHIADVDTEKNIVLLDGKEFTFYNSELDSILYKQKHPNWPIHISGKEGKDSIVNVPLNLEVLSGLANSKFIYTYGLDKSIRKWNKSSGDLAATSSISTPPSEDTIATGIPELRSRVTPR